MSDGRPPGGPSDFDDLEFMELRAAPSLGISAVVVDTRHPVEARIDVWGELTEESAPDLTRMLDALFDDGVTTVGMNLFGLVRCTEAGVEAIQKAQSRAVAARGHLRIYNARGTVRRALDDGGVRPDVALGPDLEP